MSDLARVQEMVLGALHDEAAPLPAGWDERQRAGLAIYRNNYRSTMVEALRATFPRTERLVGEDSFRAAAAHHCIACPPASWTLDHAGLGFAQTCAALFAEDPDVAEVAALEWAMGEAFTAADAEPLALADFAAVSAAFDEADLAALRLAFVPALAVLHAAYDLVRLWPTLAADSTPGLPVALTAPGAAVVWREDERPVFVLRSAAEGAALAAMRGGASFGEACTMLVAALGEAEGAAHAGAMLARWFDMGLVAGCAQYAKRSPTSSSERSHSRSALAASTA